MRRLPLCLPLLALGIGILSTFALPAAAAEPEHDAILQLPVPGNPTATPEPQDSVQNPEVVLPLPGKNSPGSVGANGANDPSVLIPLPGQATHAPQTATPQQPDAAPHLDLPSTPPAANDPLSATPPAPPQAPAGNQAQPANGDALPAFPKDTSSAVFMVMKTWECNDYDGHTLINHAVGVYGKESEDQFEIKGLDRLTPFKLTLKEDDVTLDELLDAIAAKTGLDWGVDISQKTIFLYPKKL